MPGSKIYYIPRETKRPGPGTQKKTDKQINEIILKIKFKAMDLQKLESRQTGYKPL